MLTTQKTKPYERKITPFERLFAKSPFSIVTVVARIRGDVSESLLRNAVCKAQQRHPNLRVRIQEDDSHVPWFTSDGVGEIQIELVPRKSADHWIQVAHESSQLPFEFEKRPAIRFILVHSPAESELVILCHHILCDGLSLAFLARDLMVHLGDPDCAVEVLPDPAPIHLDTIPSEVSANAVAKFFINRINKKWKDPSYFDQDDYDDLSAAYWMNAKHRLLTVELSEAETSALVDRCRAEKVTVNSALTAAFTGAQVIIQGDKPFHSKIAVAGSLRDRVLQPPGEAMGFFAGIVHLDYAYDSGTEFWENARRLHSQLKPLFTNKNLFRESILWCYLDPAILEAINFKKLGRLVPAHLPRHKKLSAFGQQDDVVLALLKRNKMEALDRVYMGTAVTNLTRLDFPRQYGDLELDRLIMNPGGAFPLANVNLVLGAVTCAGKLSLLLEYEEGTVDTPTMERVRDQAMEFLLGE